MDRWKVRSTCCYHCNYKLVTLKLYSSCSYIVVTKLHICTISHIVSYIHCNSCNLSNNIHPHRNTLSYNELQMVTVTQKPSCKASYKSPHFLIVPFLSMITVIDYFCNPLNHAPFWQGPWHVIWSLIMFFKPWNCFGRMWRNQGCQDQSMIPNLY